MRDYIKKVIIGKHEQGYQAMKEDKGNYVDGKLVGTKFGISAPVLKRYLGRTPTVQDMKNLKLDTALDILENQYYKGPKIDKLPISIRKNVLDMAINAGPGRAIKILQGLVGAKQDGAIGPKTLKKLRESKITNNDYVDARRDFYLKLVERKPVYNKFRRGWLNRVESFRDKEPIKVVEKSIKVEEEDFSEDQKFDSPQEFEKFKDETQDQDIAIEQKKIIEEAKQPKQEIKAEDIELEETIPMDQSVPYGVYAQGTDEFDMAERQEKDEMMLAAEGGEVNPRIPRKKGQPAKSKKHSDLYTDEDPVGTIQGLGFKDVPTAKASVSKIRKSSRSHAHKVQAAVAMEQRAREMGKTSEAAVYRKFIDQMKEKTKEMSKAEGGEIRYQEGGEVYDVPEYLERPKQNDPQDFMLEDITETEVDEIESRPDPFTKRERSPDFQGVREYQLSQMSVDELMSKKVPGQPQEPAVTRELARRKKEFGGMSLKRLAELDRDQEQREEAKRQKDEAERQRKKFQQLNRTKVEDKSQKELDESELRKALDDSIVQAEKAAQSVDPKRFYKNMSTFNKIVSLVGLAAGAYSSYKYGTPDTYLKLLNKQVDEDIKSQQLGLEGERRKLAAAKFKVGQIAKKLALSTKNEEQKIRLLEVFQKQRTAGIKELKKLQDEQQLTNVNRIVNTRGITDDELSKFDSKYRKLKLRDSMIKGRNGLNYYVRGGPSNINKVKAYLADAQDSIDGLTDLYSYFDKISIVDQAAPIFSIDAAAAQSLRDRLVGKLRIEFFGPGVMTDQERAQAKKILGDPNALLTTDSREKPKILKLIMKLNYGVRDKLRRDGVAIQKTPNDLRIQQILSRRRLQDNAKNRRSVIDGLIKAEIDAQKAGAKPGTIWNMNEPLPI